MARYTGPVCKLCRREGSKLYLKGDRCYTGKCGIEKRNYIPGQHGQSRAKKKISQYGIQLREKQKLRRIYGMLEKQFKNTFINATRKKGVVTGEYFIQLIECRFDNVVFRSGFAASRSQARQLIRHRHFLLNGRIVDIPSCLIKPGDEITVKEKSKEIIVLKENMSKLREKRGHSWVDINLDDFKIKFLNVPGREELDIDIKEELIVEFYSK